MESVRDYIKKYQDIVEYFILQDAMGKEIKVSSEDAEFFIDPNILDEHEVEYCQKNLLDEYCILYYA